MRFSKFTCIRTHLRKHSKVFYAITYAQSFSKVREVVYLVKCLLWKPDSLNSILRTHVEKPALFNQWTQANEIPSFSNKAEARPAQKQVCLCEFKAILFCVPSSMSASLSRNRHSKSNIRGDCSWGNIQGYLSSGFCT